MAEFLHNPDHMPAPRIDRDALLAKALTLRPRGRMRWILPAAVIPALWWLVTARDSDGNPRQARPWQVTAYSTLPLRALSRWWGKFNDIELPIWLRSPSFKLYAWIFGAKLNEMADPNLAHYKNLGEFFYREIRPEVRPIDQNALLVSPSDGKVLQFGQLVEDRIEKVKGVSYTLAGLLGPPEEAPHLDRHSKARRKRDDETTLGRHAEFAEINGIAYTLDDVVGSAQPQVDTEKIGDAVGKDPQSDPSSLFSINPAKASDSTRLYYAVIYLAPGDYHRFHSPVDWVAQLRRHFVGELFSVSPYFQSRLTDLFCLNERVALLGHWPHGFFSMTPVGATNVGSITINFDRYLRTNTRYIDGQRARKTQCYEATYETASSVLRGYPLKKGEEMGGFHLGSTIVLVFEAPRDFEFVVTPNQTICMGEALGVASSPSRSLSASPSPSLSSKNSSQENLASQEPASKH